MKIIYIFLLLSIFSLNNLFAKNIGIAWVGKSSMQDRALKGFLLQMEILKSDFNIEIKKELKSVEELKVLALKWNKEKDGMVLLRSTAAKMLSTTKTDIPTFIGGTNHPIELGAVKNFMKPEGNITGVTYYINKKTTLTMIKILIPDLKSIMFVGEKGHPSTSLEQKETQELSKEIFHIEYYEYISDNIGSIVEEIKNKKDKVSAIILGNQALVFDNAGVITKAAGNTPVFAYSKGSISNGALAGYVADDIKLGRELANSVYSILYHNKKIKEVPIKIDKNPIFYVNKSTLKRLNLRIPYRLESKVQYVKENKSTPSPNSSNTYLHHQ